jgi:hypothetical protein
MSSVFCSYKQAITYASSSTYKITRNNYIFTPKLTSANTSCLLKG